MTLRKRYFLLALLLFLLEVLIAVYIDDRIIRPYVGDMLVVMLIYCFIRSFLKVSIMRAAFGTLILAYIIEFLQYLNLIKFLGLQNSKIAKLVLGNYFEWIDILAYTVGICLVIFIEKQIEKQYAKDETSNEQMPFIF